MIQWRHTWNGYPSPGDRVLVWYGDDVVEAIILVTPAGLRWEIYDTPDGYCETGTREDLYAVMHWSEKNKPWNT